MDKDLIIQYITSICPHKDGLKINTTKSGSHSIFFYGVRAMQISVVSKRHTIAFDAGKITSPEQYGLPFKTLKSPEPSVRFDIQSELDLELLHDLIEDVFKACSEEVAFDSFGCCSSFTECSDATCCLHLDDPEYWGCQYRRNLEKGMIFYGKNKTI